MNPKTGEPEQVENLGFTERIDGTLNDGKPWQGSGAKGKRVGIAYELENGEIIYVPE